MPLFSFRMGEGGISQSPRIWEGPSVGGWSSAWKASLRLVMPTPPLCSLLGEVAIGGWAGRSYRRAPPGGSLGPLGRVDCETGDELSLALVTSHPAFIQVPLRAAFS